ncbi:MAG TPA: hypothetical protein VGR28_15070 [Candidatus Thermoplasmatota archaeon]|jgi:hypothetical protein|nr:hypothetical protein [Candidatus Thermoplasmatota archaeon]
MALELDGHQVFDWNRVPLGIVRALARNDRTHEPRTLVVELDPSAREALGVTVGQIEIPMRFVASMGRGEVVLDRGAGALGRGPGFPPA